MGFVALTSLMATIEVEFLIPNHRVRVDDEKPLKSLFQKLSYLQDFVEKEYNKGKGGAPNRDVEIKIRDFALRAEDAIEIQLRKILLPTHKEHQDEAHGELHQTLQQVAKDAEDLLNASNEVQSMDNNSLPLIRWSEPASHCSPELEDMAPEFEEIGESLVEECQGLPRSVVMVADRLSKCNYTLKEWKKVEKELLSLGTLYTDTQHSSKLIDMYNQLPQHLKVCFLYFAVFPKRIDIPVERLFKLWIAEGFVKPLRGVPLEDIASKYLQDLERRCLVRVTFSFRSLKQKTCFIHNDMHSFCVREAQKEGLLCAVNTRQCIGWPIEVLANSCRWLSLRSHILDYHVLFSSNIPRSLFFFHEDCEMFLPFRHLRILDFSQSLILKRVPLPLGDLIFLRYLSVPQWFASLDDVVSANSNLQTLIVSGVDKSKLRAPTIHLPSKIWEPQQLRHLELGDMYMVDPPDMVKEHLQTLCCAMPIHFRKEMYYCRFPSIRKLKILYKDVLGPGWSSRGKPIITLENIEDLLRLETLTVIAPVGCITLLERLVFPANLTKLRLSGTNFPVKVLRVIGELPVLKVLKLENAFYGRVWEVAEGGFCELEYLLLEAKNLEQWVAVESHFPKLDKLLLRRCYFLEEIPPSFAEGPHPFFWSIELQRCALSVFTSAKWIQEEAKCNGVVAPKVIVNGKIV